ncbi:MAG: hypothetical protein PWQ28_349 [Candidatus Woesearchaeota archaeon]|nr:hypothetical protein [Candidatus Woesearchaeota archaeon]MDK2908114.1 hypothetical protein [Candidatus Woesearchaeota archaeon]
MSESKILLDFLECIAHQYNELSELNIINLESNVKKIKPKTKITVRNVKSSSKKSIESKKEELISKIESLEKKLNKIKSSKDSERIKQLRRKLKMLKNKLLKYYPDN